MKDHWFRLTDLLSGMCLVCLAGQASLVAGRKWSKSRRRWHFSRLQEAVSGSICLECGEEWQVNRWEGLCEVRFCRGPECQGWCGTVKGLEAGPGMVHLDGSWRYRLRRGQGTKSPAVLSGESQEVAVGIQRGGCAWGRYQRGWRTSTQLLWQMNVVQDLGKRS